MSVDTRSTDNRIWLNGMVVEGRGKASSLVEEYQNELKDILNCSPYPGSLNLILDKPVALNWESAFRVSFGKRAFWIANLKRLRVLVYRSEKMPMHVLEIVSCTRLREHFGLETGDMLKIELSRNDLKSISPWHYFWWKQFWKGREGLYYSDDDYTKKIKQRSRRLWTQARC